MTQVPGGTLEKPQFSKDTVLLSDTVITGSFKGEKSKGLWNNESNGEKKRCLCVRNNADRG